MTDAIGGKIPSSIPFYPQLKRGTQKRDGSRGPNSSSAPKIDGFEGLKRSGNGRERARQHLALEISKSKYKGERIANKRRFFFIRLKTHTEKKKKPTFFETKEALHSPYVYSPTDPSLPSFSFR